MNGQSIDTSSWFGDTAPTHIEAGLGFNGSLIIDACQRARDIVANGAEPTALVTVIEELHSIAIKTGSWPEILPASWLPWKCNNSSSVHGQPESEDCVHYTDIWIANTWNCHRTYQAHLYEALYECYSHLAQNAEDVSSAMEEILAVLHGLVRDMLDSIPFLMGIHDMDGIATDNRWPELGLYYAVGVTDCVGRFALASDEQQALRGRWVRRSLELGIIPRTDQSTLKVFSENVTSPNFNLFGSSYQCLIH